MKLITKTLVFFSLVAAPIWASAEDTSLEAANRAAATSFYTFLSNPVSEEAKTAFLAATSPEWQSIGDYSGHAEPRDAFVGQVGGFGQLMPDLAWTPQSMIVTDGAVIVRSRATGTPVAPFFGVDGQGRSFDIMSIDIHEIEDGLIIRTYHVEDWATALGQLRGQ